jgi:hypothetical protein
MMVSFYQVLLNRTRRAPFQFAQSLFQNRILGKILSTILVDVQRQDQITLSKVKRRSLDRGYPFDLDVEHLRELWTGFCPIFGFEIKIGQTGTGHALYDSAALDRKIPSLGYVKGNVIWLSTKANLIKQNATAEEVMAVAIWMKENI